MTFASVYEILDPIDTVRKQRSWDWFDGDQLRSFWKSFNRIGSGSTPMSDTIDGGIRCISGTVIGNDTMITQNNINHYSQTASVFIGICRNISGAGLIQYGAGFVKDESSFGNNDVCMVFMDTGNNANVSLHTANASAQTVTGSDIAVHTNWFSVKIELLASTGELTLDGLLKITTGLTLPTAAQQVIAARSLCQSTGARESRARYVEAYNT